jgi:hypothetical protein
MRAASPALGQKAPMARALRLKVGRKSVYHRRRAIDVEESEHT